MGGAPHRRRDEPAALAAAGRPGRAPGRPSARRALRERLPLVGRREPAGARGSARASRCWSGASPPGSRRSPRARAPLDRRDAPMSDVADRPQTTTPAEIVAAADALRPQLYAEQAATEERSYYSQELHEAFREAGFYRLLMPRRYGGLEFDLPTYYRVITSIARGCPSSGWMLALGIGARPAARLLLLRARAGRAPRGRDTSSPRRASASRTRAPTASTAATASAARGTSARASPTRPTTCRSCRSATAGERIVAVVPRVADFRMLDNWGDLIGLKGSGSHSVVIEDVTRPRAPHDHARGVDVDRRELDARLSPPRQPALRRVRSLAVALGELNSVQVGAAQGAIDEYERLLARPDAPGRRRPGRSRGARPRLPAHARPRARVHRRRRTRS